MNVYLIILIVMHGVGVFASLFMNIGWKQRLLSVVTISAQLALIFGAAGYFG